MTIPTPGTEDPAVAVPAMPPGSAAGPAGQHDRRPAPGVRVAAPGHTGAAEPTDDAGRTGTSPAGDPDPTGTSPARRADHMSSTGHPDRVSPAEPDNRAAGPLIAGALVIGEPGRAAGIDPRLLARGDGPPDTVMDWGWIGELDIRAASVRGLFDRHEGLPRQDAYGWAIGDDGRWLVAVVADGVGQGALSHAAAQIVTRYAPARIAEQLTAVDQDPVRLDWYEIFTWLARQVIERGRRLVPATDHEPDGERVSELVAAAMGTTVSVVVCETRCGSGGRRQVHVAWLGDSPVWTLTPTGSWRCLTDIKNSGKPVATSEAAALPRLPAVAAGIPRRDTTVGADDAILLMSDGVGDPLDDGTGAVGDTLGQLWRRPPDPLLMCAQVGFLRRSFQDDRTTLGIWGGRKAPL